MIFFINPDCSNVMDTFKKLFLKFQRILFDFKLNFDRCVTYLNYLIALITLLRVPYVCHFGSTSFVLPIRPKYGILN